MQTRMLRDIQSIRDVDIGHLMLQSLIRLRSSEKVRLQLMVEYDPEGSRDIRPLAFRVTSGHSALRIIDPSRLAIECTPEIIRMFPGCFHMTNPSLASEIVKHGLKPG